MGERKMNSQNLFFSFLPYSFPPFSFHNQMADLRVMQGINMTRPAAQFTTVRKGK